MNNHIYVGNLRGGVSEEALIELFLPFGRVMKVIFPLGRDTGARRGFAFVTMGSSAEAAAALDAIGHPELDGRAVTLQRAETDSPGRMSKPAAIPVKMAACLRSATGRLPIDR